MLRLTNLYILVISLAVLIACQTDKGSHHISNELLVAETVLYEVENYDIANESQEDDPALQSHYKVSYPKITDQISEETLNQINSHIYTFISDSEKQISEAPDVEQLAHKLFKEHAEVYEDREWAPAWLVNKTVSIESKVGVLITLSFNEAVYTGGAHPNSYTIYKIFDLSTGDEVKLYDIIDQTNKDQLNQLRLDEFIKQKSELLPDGDWKSYVFEEQFEPKGAFNENENLKISADGFEFYYNSYEIAAYAFGPTQLVIPASKIKPLLRKDSPYYNSLNNLK